MSDEALVSVTENVRDWLGTDLAQVGFAETVRAIVGEKRYRLLVTWASPRGARLSADAIAEAEQVAAMVRALFVRWEFIEVPKAWRHAERQDRQ